MNRATLCLLTNQLFEACGGVQRAATLCRVSDKHLYRYRDENSEWMLPIDVMMVLERECGRPILSKALFEASPQADGELDPVKEAMEVTEAAGDFQRVVRLTAEDGKVTPREMLERRRALNVLRQQLAEAEAALDQTGAA